MEVSNLKARNFLGFMGIRSGLLVVALLQIVTGVALFMSFKFVRPSLVGVAWFLLCINCFSAILGIYGLWKRNQPVETIYLATFLVGLAFLILVILTFSDIIELLPPVTVGTTSQRFQDVDIDAHYRARARAAFNRLKANPMFAEVMEHIYLANPSDSAALQFPHLEIPKFEVPDYEHMPFVPHGNVTAGETDEISAGELPPETKHLSKSQKEEVVAMAKMQKHNIKLGIAVVLSFIVLFQVYCAWIIITFIMNKCMSFDEMIGAAEQFTPLVGAEE